MYETKLMMRTQFWRYGEGRVTLQCHSSMVTGVVVPVRVRSMGQIDQLKIIRLGLDRV